MPGSNFSIINGADGVSKVPVSSPVNDTNGNTVVAHLGMTSVAGVATPISTLNPAPVSVTNFPATQAISATAFPLPTGAATAANQPTLNGDGGALAHVTNFPATQPVSGSVNVANFPTTQSVSGTFWQVTQPVSLVALPALGTGGNTIGAVTQSSSWSINLSGALPTGSNAIGSVSVSNFPATQPVSGSVSVSNLPATQPISAASLPLPTGAATAANQAAPGPAGSPSAAVLSVQGVAGGTPQPVAAFNGVSLTASTVTLAAGTSTQVIGANTARKSLAVFFLSGTATDYLTPGAAATAANGIPLGVPPSGGVSLGQAYAWEGSGVPAGAVNMLCASPASVIVWEGQ